MVATRILIIIGSLGGGGAERVVVDLCGSLIEAGRDVTLLTLCGDDPDVYELPAGVRRERVEVRYSPYFPGHSLVFYLVRILQMRRCILANCPDVVLSFIDQANIRALLSLWGTGVPVVVSERTNPARHRLALPWRVLRRLSYRRATTLVVQTKDAARWFSRDVAPDRIAVIPNAVRTSAAFRQASSGATDAKEKIVLAVGRLVHVKGFDMLLEAVGRSGIADSGWRLILLGDGDEREALTARARLLGVSLELPGYVDNVPAWLARASIFALSSRYEGFPNVLIEAMQMGRACVSFDCQNGPRDIVDDGRNGILVEEGSVAGLAAALSRLANDEGLRARLGRAAVDVQQKFSSAEIYARWRDVLDRARASSLGTR